MSFGKLRGLAQIEQIGPAQMVVSIEWIVDLGAAGVEQAQKHKAVNATVTDLTMVITIDALTICF